MTDPNKPTAGEGDEITDELNPDELEEESLLRSPSAGKKDSPPRPPPRTRPPPSPLGKVRRSNPPGAIEGKKSTPPPIPRASVAPSRGPISSASVRTPMPTHPVAAAIAPTTSGSGVSFTAAMAADRASRPPESTSQPPRPVSVAPGAPISGPPSVPPRSSSIVPPPLPSKTPRPGAVAATPMPMVRPSLPPAVRPAIGPRATNPSVTLEIEDFAEISLIPSESLSKSAERPLATQPGSASLAIQRAKNTAAEIERHLDNVRAARPRGDEARIARLLIEEGLAWERAGDLVRSSGRFDEAMKHGPELLPAVQGARRILWGNRDHDTAARTRAAGKAVAAQTKGPTLPAILQLLEHEARLSTKESERADLLVERGRILEAREPRDERAILEAYRSALALCPAHAEALKALEGALWWARAEGDSSPSRRSVPPGVHIEDDPRHRIDAELSTHCGRLASAYGGDPELVASYLATRAQILERMGDLVAAEEAYASALNADGRAGPVRESYKRLLQKRGAFARLRDVLAEEAGREHDMARSVRLLYEAARISLERLGDASQAATLLEHAASRAPTDPSVDARVLDELVRLLDARGDAKAAVVARRSRIAYEHEPSICAMEYRRLAANYEAVGDAVAAIGALEAARAIEPLHVTTQLALDRLHASLGNHTERIALWLDEAAKAREPARRAAGYVRAAHVAEDNLGHPEEALDYLRAAWVTDTGNIDAFDELTRLLLPPSEMRHGVGGGEGRSAKALIELFTQAVQVTSEPARKIAYLEKVAALCGIL